MIKLVGFHIDEEIQRKFKAKVALLGLTQDQVFKKFVEEYVKND